MSQQIFNRVALAVAQEFHLQAFERPLLLPQSGIQLEYTDSSVTLYLCLGKKNICLVATEEGIRLNAGAASLTDAEQKKLLAQFTEKRRRVLATFLRIAQEYVKHWPLAA